MFKFWKKEKTVNISRTAWDKVNEYFKEKDVIIQELEQELTETKKLMYPHLQDRIKELEDKNIKLLKENDILLKKNNILKEMEKLWLSELKTLINKQEMRSLENRSNKILEKIEKQVDEDIKYQELTKVKNTLKKTEKEKQVLEQAAKETIKKIDEQILKMKSIDIKV